MGERDLAVFVLQDVGDRCPADAGRAALEAGGVLAQRRAAAAGLDADQPHLASGMKS